MLWKARPFKVTTRYQLSSNTELSHVIFWSAWWRISKTKRKNGCYLLLDHTSYSSFLDSNLRADMWSSASWLVSSSSLLRSKGSFCLLYKTSRERSYSSFPKSAGLTPNPHWSDNTDSSVSAVTSGWLLIIAFFLCSKQAVQIYWRHLIILTLLHMWPLRIFCALNSINCPFFEVFFCEMCEWVSLAEMRNWSCGI